MLQTGSESANIELRTPNDFDLPTAKNPAPIMTTNPTTKTGVL
jgi:hypothetical protein